MKLRDYQVAALEHIEGRRLAGDVRVPIVLATGLGKGHPLDTEVPTPHGFRRWGDLRIGDEIFGRDGRSTHVTNIFDRGELPTYRVTFSDGASLDVDGDHLWAVRDSAKSRRPWVTMSTATLAGQGLKRERGWRFHIPMMGAARYDAHVFFPLDPYTVGALISNGSMVGYASQLTTPDRSVVDRIASHGGIVTAIDDATPGVCPRYYLPGLQKVTAYLGMRVSSKEKRIPARYLTAPVWIRIALLHGLMDGDGAKRDDTRRSVAYFTSSLGLAEDVRELVNSLGGTGIVKRYDRGDKGIEYAVRILLPEGIEAFSTARKSGNGSTGVRNLQPKRAIVSIEPTGVKPIRCITVDAPDHLYVIGRSYIVTHNTQIFTTYIDRWLTQHPGQRALVIAHTDELIEQAARRMRQIAPKRRTGIVKAERDEVLAEIVVSSRQTLAGAKRRERLKNVGLIVIDECHHAVRTNTYGKILEHFGAFDDPSPVFVLGVTATLARTDKSKLSSVWQSCGFAKDILFGIRNGYLLDVRGERITVPDLDMSRVRLSGGDYRESDLAEELERTFAPETIAREYARLAWMPDTAPDASTFTHRKGIAFWPLVETAYHGCRAFEAEGIPSAVVHGGTPRQERRDILQRFHEGSIRVVHNAMVLTEGFDEPSADVVVIARPTRSAPLYQQMVGRVLRPDLTVPPEQREKALILRAAGKEDDDDELTLRTLIDLSPEQLKRLEETNDDTSLFSLSEYEDLLEEIEKDLDEKRAGATTWFDSPTYTGETKTKTFDPLGRDKVWGQTPDGNYHITAGNAYVFLAESINGDPGTWDVVMCSKQAYAMRNSTVQPWVKGTEHQGLHLDMALSWAEEKAVELGGVGTKTLTSRKSAWRRAEPTDAQKRLATMLKIEHEGMTKGELSEAIDATQAARRIDPLVAQIKAFYAEQEYKQNKVHKRLCGAQTAEECVCDAV